MEDKGSYSMIQGMKTAASGFIIGVSGVGKSTAVERRISMKAWKKGLAVVLAAAMCVGSVPGNAFARDVLDTAGDEASFHKMQETKSQDVPGADEAAEQEIPLADEAEQEVPAASEQEIPLADEAEQEIPAASEQEIPSAGAAEQEVPAASDETFTGDAAASQVQTQASDATGSPIEESFITLTQGQELHQTTAEKAYYVFAPEESGWYHLVIESRKTGDYFTAGVYETLYYEGQSQKKRVYRDSDYKVANAAKSDYAMWLSADEKYVFHCSISRYTDSSDMDVALTMKKAQVAGIETVTAPTQPSDFAFVGTGMKVKINYTDGDFVTSDVKCTITDYTGGGGAVNNVLEPFSWSGIAVQRGESIGNLLQVLALDEDREKTDVAELPEGSHTAVLGISHSVSGVPFSNLECSTSFEVSHNPIKSISMVSYTDTYTQNMAQYLGNITIKAVYKNGKTELINSNIYQSLPFGEENAPDMPGMEYALTDIDAYLAGGGSLGETTVTVRYQGLETSYQITILEYPYNGMSVKPAKTVYYINAGYNDTQNGHSYAGERITKNNLHQIELSRKEGGSDSYYAYNNQFSALPYAWTLNYGIELNGESYTDIDAFIGAGGTPGQHEVSVSYRDFTTSYAVDIRQNPYVRMEIAQLPEQLNYSYGSSRLYLEGLVIRAYKNDTEYDTYTYGQNAPAGAAVASWQQYFRCYPVTDNFYARPSGDHTVYITFLNMRAEFQVHVDEPPTHPEYVDMEILKKPGRTLYYVKENENLKDCLSLGGLELALTDSEGEVKKFKYNTYEEEGFSSWGEISSGISVDWGRIDWATPGNYVVSVYYKELCVEFEVTIADSPVDSFQILRMPETDTYYFYENKTISSPNLLRGLAYKVTFEDGSVHAATFKNNYRDKVFQVGYQGRTYTIGCSWARSTSGGAASAGENALQFTLFGETYQTDPITILENPVASLQVIRVPEKMIYVGENTEADLYGAKLRITYQGGRTKEIEVSEHGSSVLVEEDQKYITAQISGTWEPDEDGGPGYHRKNVEITYLNEKTLLEADLKPAEMGAVALRDNGQSAGILTAEQPYRIFSFTPEEEKRYAFFCVDNSFNGSSYPIYNFCVDFYDGDRCLSTGYAGSFSSPVCGMQPLTPGHTYYYVVSSKSEESRDLVPFECYLSSDILYDQQLGNPEVEIIDTEKKVWYEYELAGATTMLNFEGTKLKLTYPNGWTEQKSVSGFTSFLLIGGKNYNVGWKYMDPQSGWLPEIRDDNALVYTCEGETIKEIPIQLNVPDPIESLTIDVNPYDGCYEYELQNGHPSGLTVTAHFKDPDRADETVVWDGSYQQKIDGALLMYRGVAYTNQIGEHGGRICRISVDCMNVTAEASFEAMPSPVTGFELIEPPANCGKYPFEDSGDLDLYGMEYAIVYRDGTKQNIRVTEHGSEPAVPEGSTEELNVWYTSENREGENGEPVPVTVLNLEYMGHKQKLADFEHRPFPAEQAEELSDTRTNYIVLGEGSGYRLYRFTSADSTQYTLNMTGNINFRIFRYGESGEEAVWAEPSGQNRYTGSMQWDMAAGDTVYFAVKPTEPYIGSLRAEISGEAIEKEDIPEIDFHVENPVAGEPFPATEQGSMDEYRIASSQWYGDKDADGRADFAEAHRLMLVLAPKPRYRFTENTKITFNGSEAENVILGADGRITLYVTFPYTDCKIELPQADGYTLRTGWNSQADRVSYGGTYRFQYLDAEGMPDETLSVKANGNVVALDEENYYTLTDVTENITVTVRTDISDIVVGEDESKITMHNRSEDVYDIMVGKKEQAILDNEAGNNTLPLLPSYTDGSEDFFYGWYLDRDEALNGRGTRFTSATKLLEDAYELFAKWGSGIFYQRVGKRNAVYQVISFDEYNHMKVEMKGIRRSEIRMAARNAIDAAGADESGRLEIPAEIAQEQMQLQEGLDLDIESCTVVAVADSAFAGETGITSVVLPETIERIGADAFENCADLEEAVLQRGVTEIGDHAFADCTSLKKIVLPDTVEKFGERIFEGCGGITVVLPDTIETIEPAVFEGADDITIICSRELEENGALEELRQTGVKIQTLDLVFAYENGEKTFSYGGKEERLVVNVLINGEMTEETEEHPLLWQYTDTDAYAFRADGNDLYVTPKRRTVEEEEISVTVTDVQTNAKTVLTLHTAAADLAEKDAKGKAVYTVEVTEHPVYSGEEQRPSVVVYRETARLDASDYEAVYTDNINAGIGQITVTGKGNYTGSITTSFTIEKAAQAVIAFDMEKTTDNLVFPINAKATGGGKLNYSSSDLTIASVDEHGIVILRGIGTAEIRIWASENANYQASAVRKITLTVKPADIIGPKPTDPSQNPDQNQPNTNQPSGDNPDDPSKTDGEDSQNGLKAAKAAYTKALGSKPFSLGVTANTAIRYTSSKPKTVSVNASGKVTLHKCGKAVITAAAGGDAVTITICVVPKKAAAKAASKKSGELTVSWPRQKEASGYMVEYSTKKGFQKNVSKKVVKNNKSTSVTLKNLKKGKKYYVRVKAYTVIDGKKKYGTASKTIPVTVKK